MAKNILDSLIYPLIKNKALVFKYFQIIQNIQDFGKTEKQMDMED